jgi:hypothetical protein
VDYEGAITIGVVGDSELLLDVLQGEYVGDGFRMEPYLAIVPNMGLHIGGKIATVAVDSHAVSGLPDTGNKLAVAKQVNRALVVEKDHLSEIGGKERGTDKSKAGKLGGGLAFIRIRLRVFTLSKGGFLVSLLRVFGFFQNGLG